MKSLLRGLVALAVCVTGLSSSAAASAAEVDSYSAVDPFIGTSNHGNTFPGVQTPFGMAQPSPDTDYGQKYSTTGYDYQQSHFIRGFSQNRLNGMGCYGLGFAPVMPTTGALKTNPTDYQSTFSHSSETSHPGEYSVSLDSYGVKADVTATDRTSWYRFNYGSAANPRVLIDAGTAIADVRASDIHIVDQNTITGSVSGRAFCNTERNTTMFFVAKFSKPFTTDQGTWGTQGAHAGAYASFAPGGDPLVLKMGISYTSVDGAQRNLDAEGGAPTSFDFDGIKSKAVAAWRKQLNAITVSGGNIDNFTTFYTSLYHVAMNPNIFSDVDGSYIGPDDVVRKAVDYTSYANYSLWDTYRTQEPLLALIAPERSADIVASIDAFQRQSGTFPKWSLNNIETNTMSGDPITPFLSDAQMHGAFSKVNIDDMYAAMVKNATTTPPQNAAENPEGRMGVADYIKNGYVPQQDDTLDSEFAASITLEYTVADCSLSLLAQRLGKPEADVFDQRSRNYRTLWDPTAGYIHGRGPDGQFYEPVDPLSIDNGPVKWNGFEEGSAAQYSWLPAHDMMGLTDLMGGTDAVTNRLDSLFDYPNVKSADAKTLRQTWAQFVGNHFDISNEPTFHVPFLYSFVGHPERTQEITRLANTLFTNTSDGLPGNDDLGASSAWYVFSALGMYPIEPGSGTYALTSPIFDKATINYGDSVGAHKLEINAPNASNSTYISSANVNGTSLSGAWMSYDQIRRGGQLTFSMSSSPTTWGANVANAPPSACGAHAPSPTAPFAPVATAPSTPPAAQPVATTNFATQNIAATKSNNGYRLAGSDGGVFAYGDSVFYGSAGGAKLNKPIVGMTSTPSGNGYWIIASDGGVFAYGDAAFYGSTGSIKLNKPIVGITSTPSGKGYWLVASDGGVFAFGDAAFLGSTGSTNLNKPIVSISATPSGNGYWLTASDGGVFAYGDAAFYGSTGSTNINKPIVGMTPTPSGHGYWLVASDGGIFAYGDAAFLGSTGATKLNRPIVGMQSTPTGNGYWLAASDGGIFSFGDAPFKGSAGGLGVNNVVGIG